MRADRLTRRPWRVGVAGIAHRLDHAIGRATGKRRVLVDVRTPMNAAVLRPLWSNLSRDPRISISFVAEQPETVRTTLARDGVERSLISQRAAIWQRWDLVMTADAWNHTPVRRCRRRVQFFHGVAGKYDLDVPQHMCDTDFPRFDRVAFINDDRMQRYVSAGLVSLDQAVLIGYPPADDLVNGRWSAESIRRSLALDPQRTTIVYAPTFSVAGSLHQAGPAIIDALLDAGFNVIVKLHDRSMVPDAHHTAGIDWRTRFASLASHPRFAFAQGAEIEPLLAAADALVTDHSTVGFEFALLDRPIIVFDAPELLRAARIGRGKWDLLRSMATVARTPDETVAAVSAALKKPGELASARLRARALFAFPGTATARALTLAYELLGVPAPAGGHEVAAATLFSATSVGRSPWPTARGFPSSSPPSIEPRSFDRRSAV